MPITGPRVAVVHHGFLPIYRIAFYERLAAASEVEYVIFHGQAPRGTGHVAAEGPFAFPNVRVRNREIPIGRRSLVVQPIVRRIAAGGFSGLVTNQEFKFPANFATAAAVKARGRALVFWGHGYVKAEETGSARLIAAGAALKDRLARLADGYLVYTEGGARRLVAAGVDADRVTVVRNTLDVDAEKALHGQVVDADEAALRADLGLKGDSVVLVFLGRAYAEKHLDHLIEMARRLSERPDLPMVEVAVLGDGPELGMARELAAGIPGVHFLGAVHDQLEVARWLRVAAAVAMPGKVGLVANHALAHGVPVLTRESDIHAPEVEYLDHGLNALIVPGSLDAYIDEVAHLVGSPMRLARLQAGALASREHLDLVHMVSAFDGGVRRALVRRGLA